MIITLNSSLGMLLISVLFSYFSEFFSPLFFLLEYIFLSLHFTSVVSFNGLGKMASSKLEGVMLCMVFPMHIVCAW